LGRNERVLAGEQAITCRPADLLEPELDSLSQTLSDIAAEKSIRLANNNIDDVLTYALFNQIGLKFLQNRDNPEAFEAPPLAVSNAANPMNTANTSSNSVNSAVESYDVSVNGLVYQVEVGPSGELGSVTPSHSVAQNTAAATSGAAAAQVSASSDNAKEVTAPLSGNIFKVLVNQGDSVQDGDVITRG